jgi:hypothetical protein
METAKRSAGAPKGNKNGTKGRVWSEALRMELALDRKYIRKLARALLDKASEGDVSALKELGDRLEGKAVQNIEADISHNVIERVIVRSNSKNSDS